jgi:sugar-specific transcriptional regulator TrmB
VLQKIFSQLNLSEAEAATYLALLDHGSVPAGELYKRLDIARTTLYGHLDQLARTGLAKKTKREGITYWQSEKPEYLLKMLGEKASDIKKAELQLVDLLPTLNARKNKEFSVPKFTYMEGVEGIRQILRDILLYRNISTQAFWPIDKMLDVIGDDFLAEHNAQRIRQGISIHAIWPKNTVVNKPFLGVGPSFLREIRIAPESIDCRMAYWIYANKVAFTSSKKECFGFIVESEELAETQKVQFDFIFSKSKPLAGNDEGKRNFLKKNGLM